MIDPYQTHCIECGAKLITLLKEVSFISAEDGKPFTVQVGYETRCPRCNPYPKNAEQEAAR